MNGGDGYIIDKRFKGGFFIGLVPGDKNTVFLQVFG